MSAVIRPSFKYSVLDAAWSRLADQFGEPRQKRERPCYMRKGTDDRLDIQHRLRSTALLRALFLVRERGERKRSPVVKGIPRAQEASDMAKEDARSLTKSQAYEQRAHAHAVVLIIPEVPNA